MARWTVAVAAALAFAASSTPALAEGVDLASVSEALAEEGDVTQLMQAAVAGARRERAAQQPDEFEACPQCALTEDEIEQEEAQAADILKVELLQKGVSRHSSGGGAVGQDAPPTAGGGTGADKAAEAQAQLGAESEVEVALAAAVAAGRLASNASAGGGSSSEAGGSTTANASSSEAAAGTAVPAGAGAGASGPAAAAPAAPSGEGAAALAEQMQRLPGTERLAEAALASIAAKEVKREAHRLVEEQLPDLFDDIFKASEATATMLASALNSSLAVLYDAVMPLPEQAEQLRRAMLLKVNASLGSANASLTDFEYAVSDAASEFLKVWGPVMVSLEGLHQAVPAALRVARLNDLAASCESWLGEGTGLVGLSGGFVASIESLSRSVGNISQQSIKEAGKQLRNVSDVLNTVLDQADAFTESLTDGVDNLTQSAASGLGVVPETFVAPQQTSIAIVGAVSDSVQSLGEGVGEASSLTGVRPAEPDGASGRGASVLAGLAALAALLGGPSH